MAKIIVELCQNHNGDRALLSAMIAAAAESGADIIKGQIIFSEDLAHRPRFDEGEEEANGVRKTIKRPYAPELERLRGLDLTEEDYAFFVDEVYRHGKNPMLTVFSRNRVALAARLPWRGEKLVKVASYDCASLPLVRELAGAFDKLIISTGATFDAEIEATAKLLRDVKKPFVFLHCVTSYPNTREMANLARMEWLRTFTPEVGWSDHSLVSRDGIGMAKAALALGADYIERHFSILPRDKTKDGPVSINPAELRELADFAALPITERRARLDTEAPDWQVLVGSEHRDMTHTEMLNRDYYRGRFTSHVQVENWDEKAI